MRRPETGVAITSLPGLGTTGLLIAGLVGAGQAIAQDVKQMAPSAASVAAPDLGLAGGSSLPCIKSPLEMTAALVDVAAPAW